MKRKLIAFALAVMMLAALAGCGSKSVFKKFEDELSSRGLKYEMVKMAAEMVGAQEGWKYLIGDGRVEIYKYDKSSDAYKEIERTQTMSLVGIASFPAIVTNGYAMLVEDLDTATYEAILRSMTK